MRFEASVDGRTLEVEVAELEEGYVVVVEGRRLEVDWRAGADFASMVISGRSYEVGLVPRPTGYTVVLPEDSIEVELRDAGAGPATASRRASGGPLRVSAPMPGKIVRVLVQAGQAVAAGQGLVVMEAMKMENELRAPRPGTVRELAVGEGQAVETGTLLLVLN